MVSYDLLLFMLEIENTTRGTNSMPCHAIPRFQAGSFAVYIGDQAALSIQWFYHLRSGIICGRESFVALYSTVQRRVTTDHTDREV